MRRSSPVLLFTISPLFTLAVFAAGALVRRIDADLFAGVWWTVCLLSVFFHPDMYKQKISSVTKIVLLFALPIFWILVNDRLIMELHTALRTHPDGSFLIPVFTIRLRLSLAVLKIIDALWPTDIRTVLTMLLSVAALFGLAPLIRQASARVPQKWFEAVVNGGNEAIGEIMDYFRLALVGAFSSLLIVGTITYLLGFLEAGIMTAFVALSWFIPFIGWLVGPAGCLLFVEKSQSMPQLLALAGFFLLLSQARRLLPRQHADEPSDLVSTILSTAIAGALYSFMGIFIIAPAAAIGISWAKIICNSVQTDSTNAAYPHMSPLSPK